ncbi:MAG TPA: isoprenoid biosynthesis glyoxalase ElbB [Anaeromyxobacteraceae bacterium]|nr:isoprenoid biosynthesis glyoxalase ElbB [Anaeromyxobacteraceae bacterium]
MSKAAKHVGVLLAGCGFLDGAEIHEATCTLLSLDRRGAKAAVLAPDVSQLHVVDHRSGAPVDEQRNVLAEAARIARGQARDLASARGGELDALILPGGYGAAKNLCSFAQDGLSMHVHPEVERLIREVHSAGKPLGFICISPVIGAKLLGGKGVKLTIGDDAETAAAIESFGAKHVACAVDQIVVDERLKVVSTPAYMLGPSIAPVAAGIDRLVSAILEMA